MGGREASGRLDVVPDEASRTDSHPLLFSPVVV